MFIKFNGQLYNMNNIHTVYYSERHEDDESETPKVIGYFIKLIGESGYEIVAKHYSVNQIKLWEKECCRVERWLLGYR